MWLQSEQWLKTGKGGTTGKTFFAMTLDFRLNILLAKNWGQVLSERQHFFICCSDWWIVGKGFLTSNCSLFIPWRQGVEQSHQVHLVAVLLLSVTQLLIWRIFVWPWYGTALLDMTHFFGDQYFFCGFPLRIVVVILRRDTQLIAIAQPCETAVTSSSMRHSLIPFTYLSSTTTKQHRQYIRT